MNNPRSFNGRGWRQNCRKKVSSKRRQITTFGPFPYELFPPSPFPAQIPNSSMNLSSVRCSLDLDPQENFGHSGPFGIPSNVWTLVDSANYQFEPSSYIRGSSDWDCTFPVMVESKRAFLGWTRPCLSLWPAE